MSAFKSNDKVFAGERRESIPGTGDNRQKEKLFSVYMKPGLFIRQALPMIEVETMPEYGNNGGNRCVK